MRGGQVPLDQFLERMLAVAQRLGDDRADLSGAIARVELTHALEKFFDARDGGLKPVHSS